eukprot:6197485-Pleurochrysis_carterae.AAC.2
MAKHATNHTTRLVFAAPGEYLAPCTPLRQKYIRLVAVTEHTQSGTVVARAWARFAKRAQYRSLGTARLVRRLGDGGEGRVLVGDLVDGGEEWELVFEALHLEDMVHLLGRERTLQLLPSKELRLDLLERLGLAVLGVRLGALAVAAAEACECA